MNVQSIKDKLKNVAKTNFRLIKNCLLFMDWNGPCSELENRSIEKTSRSREESFCTPSMGRITPVLLRI